MPNRVEESDRQRVPQGQMIDIGNDDPSPYQPGANVTTTTGMIGRWRVQLALAAMLLGLLIGVAMIGLSLTTVTRGTSWGTILAAVPGAHTPGSQSMGSPDARVQVVFYFDFQCSHCEALHKQVEIEIVRRYVMTGQVRMEARPFPKLGPESNLAAEASLYAADEGRFWEYRDALFAAWRLEGRSAYSAERLKQIAGQVGLNEASFSAKLNNGDRRGDVEELLRQGEALGVACLPTTLINERKLEGQQDLQSFVTAIEEELAK